MVKNFLRRVYIERYHHYLKQYQFRDVVILKLGVANALIRLDPRAPARGPPQRVEVTKTAEPATNVYRAVRYGDTLRVSVRSKTPVRLERKVAKSSFVLEGRGKARWEWVETLLSIGILPVLPFLRK